MWNQLIQALCELSAKLDSLLSEMRGSGSGSTAINSGKRIGTSITPVMRQGNSPVRLVNTNPGRLGVIIHNNSNGELMIALDAQKISGTHYTFKIRAGENLHFDLRTYGELYKGAFMGLWDKASGAEADSKALVTEIFWAN
jgi:hypothetical protein